MHKIILTAWMIIYSQGVYAGIGDTLCSISNNWWWYCDDVEQPADTNTPEGVAKARQSSGNNSQQTGRDDNSTNVTAKEINAEKVQVGGESRTVTGNDKSQNIKTGAIDANTVDMSRTGDVAGDQIKGENVTVNKGASVKKMNFEDNVLTVELDDGQQVRAVIPDPDLIKKLESLDVDALNSLDVEALKEISKLDTASLRDLTSSSTSLTEISKLDVTKLTELSKLDPEKLKGEKGDKGDKGEKGQAGIGVAGQDGRDGRDGQDGQDGLTPDTAVYALKSELPADYLTASDLTAYAATEHVHDTDDVSGLTGSLAALVHTHPYAADSHVHDGVYPPLVHPHTWAEIVSRPNETEYLKIADMPDYSTVYSGISHTHGSEAHIHPYADSGHIHIASEVEYVGVNTITTVQEAIRSLPANRSSVDSLSNMFINVINATDHPVGTLLPDVSMTGIMDAVCTVDHLSLSPPVAGRGHDILLKVNGSQVGVTQYKQPGQTATFTITDLDLTNGIEVNTTIQLNANYNVSSDPTFDAECTFTQGL